MFYLFIKIVFKKYKRIRKMVTLVFGTIRRNIQISQIIFHHNWKPFKELRLWQKLQIQWGSVLQTNLVFFVQYFNTQSILHCWKYSGDLNGKHLNNEHLNDTLLVSYPSNGLHNKPFDQRTIFNHLHTELVCYSDHHCIELPPLLVELPEGS